MSTFLAVTHILVCMIGVNSFINEYVMVRTIPIPKILYAFGVCLVSPCDPGNTKISSIADSRIPDYSPKSCV
jgi:hypothetical protein